RPRHLLLDEELPHLDRGRGPRGAVPALRVLRPDPHPSRRGPGVVGRARPPRRVRAQGRRGRRGITSYRGPAGPLTVRPGSASRTAWSHIARGPTRHTGTVGQLSRRSVVAIGAGV